MDLPYNAEAEKQVLANMIFSQDVLIDSFSRLSEDDFFMPQHKIIFATLKDIFQNNKAKVEPYALIDKLSVDGNLEKVGDASYVLELVDSYHDLTNASYYINSVAEKAMLRNIILYANNIVTKWSSESSGDIVNYINKVEKGITDITKKRRVEDFVPISEAFNRYMTRISSLKANGNVSDSLLTGYRNFDNITLGFKPGEMTILAARPSVGKSALALNFLYRVASRTKKPCVFFSLEMGIDSLTDRILAAKSGVPSRKIQLGSFSKDEESSVNKAIRDVSDYNLFIDETPAIKPIEIRAKINKLFSRFGQMGLIVVDYLGLISPDVKGKKEVSRSLEIGEILASLRGMARDFKCPILVLAQLNRNVEDRNSRPKSQSSKKPVLADLRESGNIEQDADVVVFIHRDDYGVNNKAQQDGEEAKPNIETTSDSSVEVIIAKNRNGATASIDFVFQKHIGRFVEMDKREDS